MDKLFILVVLTALIGVSYGIESTNYEISRNKLGSSNGGSYGQYQPGYYPGNGGPGLYPSGPGYPGQYPGSSYPGYQPGAGAIGPPGAHPNCPLCDSSVYSYCYKKLAHDSCCCEVPNTLPYNCRHTDCRFLNANSCEEYRLIANCCCIDLQKNVAGNVVA